MKVLKSGSLIPDQPDLGVLKVPDRERDPDPGEELCFGQSPIEISVNEFYFETELSQSG
jgi:hypothetical protein